MSGNRQQQANFDTVARVYRWAEYLALGPLLQRMREHFLPSTLTLRQALVLGDGDGRFLAALLRRAPQMQAIAVDSSAGMLTLLRRRCAFAGSRLRTACAPVAALPLDLDLHGVDLMVSHFFLDCLTQPEVDALVRRLACRVAPGALWLVSDFAVPIRQPWKTLGAAYVRLLYLTFRVLTGLRVTQLPDPAAALRAAGFARVQRYERLRGLLYTEVWKKLPV